MKEYQRAHRLVGLIDSLLNNVYRVEVAIENFHGNQITLTNADFSIETSFSYKNGSFYMEVSFARRDIVGEMKHFEAMAKTIMDAVCYEQSKQMSMLGIKASYDIELFPDSTLKYLKIVLK